MKGLWLIGRQTGFGAEIARKHYLMLTEDHYRRAAEGGHKKAAQNPAQQPAVQGCKGSQPKKGDEQKLVICGALQNNASPCDSKDLHLLPPRGLEPLSPG